MGVKGEGNTLLKFPDITKIHLDPSTGYNPSSISIRQDTFFVLINFVTSQEHKTQRISELIGRSDITPLIEELSKYQISLICHHILQLNHSILGNDVAKELSNSLLHYFIPPWLQATTHFDEVFHELDQISLPFEINNYQNFQQFIHHLSSERHKLADNLVTASEMRIINFSVLSKTLDVLITLRNSLSDEDFSELFAPVLEDLEILLVAQVNDPHIEFNQYVAMMFHLLYLYIDQTDENISSTQTIIDELWQDVESKGRSYGDLRLLFLAFYMMIIQRYYQNSMNFSSRRNLVKTIVDRYYADMKTHFALMQTILNTSKIHPWVFDKLVQGYTSYCSLLFEYIQSLPECKEKKKLTLHLEKIADQSQDFVINYLVRIFNLIPPTNDVDQFLSKLQETDLITSQKVTIYQHFVSLNKYLLFIRKDKMYQSHNQYRLDLWLKCITALNEKELVFLYEIDILMVTEQYPFGPILQQIEADLEVNQTILTSKTFENRVIQIITHALEYLANSYENNSSINEEAYLILLSFSCEWLQYFSLNPQLFIEAHGVLSAIILISFSHLSRTYYREQQMEKSFLMYLNLYFFSEYLTRKIYDINRGMNNSYNMAEEVFRKFDQMTKDWNLRNIIDVDFIKTNIKKIELIIRSSTTEESSLTSNMIDDDLLFAYLDLNEQLSSFISSELPKQDDDLFTNLDQLEIYHYPDKDSLSHMGRIGYSLMDNIENRKPLPFPFLRYIDQLAVAMSIVPVKFDLSTINLSTLKLSINEIFDFNITHDD